MALDYRLLSRWLITCPLPLRVNEWRLYHVIYSRTILWGKIVEEIPPNHVFTGNPYGDLPPWNLAKPRFYETRRTLLHLGVIIYKGRRYALNVPDLLRVCFIKAYPEAQTDNGRIRLTDIEDQVQKAEKALTSEGMGITFLSGDAFPGFENYREEFLKGIAAGEEILQRRSEKVKSVPLSDLSPRALMSYIDLTVDEVYEGAVICVPERTKKVMGQVKNYISECVESGYDPRDILYLVIQRWDYIAPQLVDDHGRPSPQSPTAFSFSGFYRCRRSAVDLAHR